MFFYLTVFVVFIVRYERKGRLIFLHKPCRSHTGGQKYCTLPFPGGAGQGCGGPVRPPAAVLSGRFFALSGQVGSWGHAVLPPILWGAGPLQEKSGSGQKSWLRARQHRLAGSGILSLDRPCVGRGVRAGKTLAEAVWALSGQSCHSRRTAAGSPSRQKAARHRKRAPEDRGPCRRWSVRPSGLGHTR